MEKLKLELLRLILDYCKKPGFDKKFFEKIIESYVSTYSLNDYVKNLKFMSDRSFDSSKIVMARYNLVNCDIEIFYENIMEVLSNFLNDDYNVPFNDLETLITNYIFITKTLLHELKHAYQMKLINNSHDNSLEKKLCDFSFNGFKILNKMNVNHYDFDSLRDYFYVYTYDFNPMERMANIDSDKLLYESFENEKKKLPNIADYSYFQYIKSLFVGYQTDNYDINFKTMSCPTEAFLKTLLQDEKWESFPFYNDKYQLLLKNVMKDFSLEDRFRYGFPISSEEFYKIDNIIRSRKNE